MRVRMRMLVLVLRWRLHSVELVGERDARARVSASASRGSRQLGLANYQFGRIYSRPLLGRHGKFVRFYSVRDARTTQVRSRCDFRT